MTAQARPLAIHEIQGTGQRSPFDGQLVTTSGVVTARRTNGVFIQTPDHGVAHERPRRTGAAGRHARALRGMVCGMCDNPYPMAALDDFRIEGDPLRFNILHEDCAAGELPTFDKHVTARAGWNEMRCTTAADHQPPPPTRPQALTSSPR